MAALAGLALHFNREGQGERAAALLRYVVDHPASDHALKEQAGEALAELSAQGTPEATPKDIEAVSREILNEELLRNQSRGLMLVQD